MLPSLPSSTPIRILAISGTIAILCFIWVGVIQARNKNRSALAWSVLVLALAAATMLLGRFGGWPHRIASVGTVVCALRNGVAFSGNERLLTLVGVVCWLVGIVVARMSFG